MAIGVFIDGWYLYEVVNRQNRGFVKLRQFIESELNDVVDEGYFIRRQKSSEGRKVA